MKTIIEALKIQIYLEIIFGLAPFLIRKNQLKTSSKIETYYKCCLCSYPFLIGFMTYSSVTELKTWFFSAGYLWVLISMFELVFTNVAFPLLVLQSFLWRHDQIQFWNQIIYIDKVLRTIFTINMLPTYNHLRFRNIFLLILTLIYYFVISMWILIKVVLTGALEVYTTMFLIWYHMEQGLTGLMTTKIINKFLTIRTLFRRLEEAQIGMNRGGSNGELKEFISMWTDTFKQTCRLIDLLSKKVGMILLLRFAHDFTLLTSQSYLIYWSYIKFNGTKRWMYILMMIYWMWPNVMKIGGVAWAAQITASEVCVRTFLLAAKR